MIGCKLTKIDDLPFPFAYGACNSFSKLGILFCFGNDAFQECHSMKISKNGTHTIKKETSSEYEHAFVLSLASYKGWPFVTGGYNIVYGDIKNKTELLNINNMKWATKADFPTNRYSGPH